MTGNPILELEGVVIAAGDDVICRDIDLTVNEGERHILIGPNGSGKSSLLCGLMGVRPFRIVAGTATLLGRDLADMSIDERSRAGIGMAFQRPPSLTGVTARRLVQTLDEHGAGADAEDHLFIADLGVDHLLDREVNRGFSGGEVKRWEVAKLGVQGPSLCLFDEPESGVDLEQVGIVAEVIDDLLSKPDAGGRDRAAIIITHTGFILDGVEATTAHLMIDGRIVESGDAHEMFERIRRDGYAPARA